jgi:hypothetical protein
VCARALVARGPEGIDAKRSPAGGLLVLGAGLAIVAGGLAVAVLDNDTDFGEINAGIPQLMPPDSGVLGISESGGDEKDRRDGEERSGKLGDDDDDDGDGDGDGDGDNGGRAGSGVEVDDRRRPKDVGDMANTPPLLPPIGSDDPDGGSPVPPLDGAPGMPPPLVPIADIGGDSSGRDHDSRDDDDGGGDGDGERDSAAQDGGSASVTLDDFDREQSAYTVELAGGSSALQVSAAGTEDPEEVARTATLLLAQGGIDVPVGVVDLGGQLIAYAGYFPFVEESERDEAEADAAELVKKIADLLPFDESPVCVQGTDTDAVPCETDMTSQRESERDDAPAELGGDLPAPLGNVGDFASGERPDDDEPQTGPKADIGGAEPSAGEDGGPDGGAKPGPD